MTGWLAHDEMRASWRGIDSFSSSSLSVRRWPNGCPNRNRNRKIRVTKKIDHDYDYDNDNEKDV
jgi:hypothetical protein